MRHRVIATMLALATGGCGASALATISSGKPVTAETHPEPQLALTRIKTANSPARPVTDLIVVTLGSRHDSVVSAGSRRGWPEPSSQPVTWSPDGRRVAFARITSRELKDDHGYPYYRTDIFIINANGSGLHRLTQTGDAWNPVWSPDGREIAFARAHHYVNVSKQTEGATANIWTVHPNGSDLRQLTAAVNGQDDEPGSFSPNGHWLAFTRTEPSPPVGLLPNTNSVELLDTTNGAVHELAGQSSDPSFSPKGNWIALTSTRDHNGSHRAGEDADAYAGELYLIDPTGKYWRRSPTAAGSTRRPRPSAQTATASPISGSTQSEHPRSPTATTTRSTRSTPTAAARHACATTSPISSSTRLPLGGPAEASATAAPCNAVDDRRPGAPAGERLERYLESASGTLVAAR